MAEDDVLILEIFKHDNGLSMSVHERDELASTLKHYSQQPLSLPETRGLCREVISALNKAGKDDSIGEASFVNLRKGAQLLWEELLTRPVKDKLRSTQINNLILSLDEELINIPWELLYDGRDFLCLKFNLGRLIRTREQPNSIQYRSIPDKMRMLILANPTNDLKSAYLEGVFIKNQFDRQRARVCIDFKSTCIDKLYVKKNLRDYDIVHFAGHCECGSSKDNGWVLSDGEFTGGDILALGETLSLPSLVFSNACNSGQAPYDPEGIFTGQAPYDPEGIFTGQALSDAADNNDHAKAYSLASAFLFSGTRHYLGTIRNVQDHLSLAFAREFYTHLISGSPVGECVRSGRLKLIKENGPTSVSWASHLLYGDPNFLLFRKKALPRVFNFKKELYARARSRKGKKLLIKFAAVLLILSAGVFFLREASILNPGAYFLFSKARKLMAGGNTHSAILISESIKSKDPFFLSIYPLLAEAYQKSGDRAQALKVYFDYARYSEKKHDHKNLASAYNGIGWIYHLQGDYPKALDFYRQGLNLSQESQDKLNEAVALRRLALWHTDKEDYDKALELLMKSSEINRQRTYLYEHKYNLACDYFDIGLIFTDKNDFPAAREFYGKSLNLFNRLGLKNELSDCYLNLGEVYMFEKQYQKALDCYLQGLAIDQRQGNKPSLAADYNMLGELYMEMDNLAEAEASFKEGVSILTPIDAKPELASLYHNLGILYKKKGWIGRAREYLRSAQEIYVNIDTPAYQRLKSELLELVNK